MLGRNLITNKQKIITAHASSAYKHALREVLEAQGIVAQIKVTRLESTSLTSVESHLPQSKSGPFCVSPLTVQDNTMGFVQRRI